MKAENWKENIYDFMLKAEELLGNKAKESIVSSDRILFHREEEKTTETCRFAMEKNAIAGLWGYEKEFEAVKLAALKRRGLKGYLEENSKEVFNMLALQWEQDKAIRASYEDGRDEGIEAIALKMIRLGKSFEDIRQITDLPLERIKKLADDLKS